MNTERFIELIKLSQALNEILGFKERDLSEPDKEVNNCDTVMATLNELEKITYSLYTRKAMAFNELVREITTEYQHDGTEEELLEKLQNDDRDEVLHKLNQLSIAKDFFLQITWLSLSDRVDCAYSHMFDFRKDWLLVEESDQTCGAYEECLLCPKGKQALN